MENSKKYTDGKVQGKELEILTEKFLRAKFDRDRKRKWGKILAEEHGVNPTDDKRPPAKTRKMILWIGAVAAAILFMLVITPSVIEYPNQSYQQLAENYLDDQVFPNLEVTKGDLKKQQLKVEAAYAYGENDFATAIEKYEEIVEMGEADDYVTFFLGLSYLYNKNYNRAIVYLNKNVEKESGSYKQEAGWFVSLAYIKIGEPDKAKPVLEEVSKEGWNSRKASRLLKALE